MGDKQGKPEKERVDTYAVRQMRHAAYDRRQYIGDRGVQVLDVREPEVREPSEVRRRRGLRKMRRPDRGAQRPELLQKMPRRPKAVQEEGPGR